MDVRAAAAGDDAFLNCRTRRVEGVFHAVLRFLHLGLGRSTDADDRDAARELRETLLKLFLIEIGSSVFDLLLDLVHTRFEVSLVAHTVDDRRVLFLDLDGFRAAELLKRSVLELEAEVGADDLAAGQDRDILQHCFSSVAVTRCLDSDNAERAAQLVDDQGRQGFAFDVLSDDEELRTHLDDLLKQRQDVLYGGDLLVGDQDVRILEVRFHLVHVGRHVSGDVASVELHAFDQVQLGEHRLGLFDRDDAVLGDLFHRVSDHAADFLVAGRDRRDLLDVVLALDLDGHASDRLDRGIRSLLHTFAHDDRVRACSEVLHAFIDHRLREDRSGRGAIARDVVRLRSDFLDELCAHVLIAVFELDLFRDRHTVVRDGGAAVSLVENNVPALRAKRDLDGVRQFVDACFHCYSGVCSVLDILCHFLSPLNADRRFLRPDRSGLLRRR